MRSMGGMGGATAAWALLLLCPLALSRLDDDFAFDNSEEFQVELTANHSEIAKNGLRRLWGVPDTSAYVGHLFRMEIPKEAFSGKVKSYKVRSENGRRTPSWLAVDSRHGLISGIPQQADLGAHTFTVTAHGNTHGLTATDSFTVEVKKSEDKAHSKYGSCAPGENRLVLTILIDGAFQQIPARHRIRALMELSHFMALDGDEFWMEPYKADTTRAQTVVMSGPGTTQRRRGDATTAIYLNVGCGEKLWARHKVLVAGVREQSRDGTLAHTLRLPVLGWRLVSVKPLRAKRQSPLDEGSGTYDSYDGEDDAGDYSGYEDDDEDDEYGRMDLAGPETDAVDPYVPTSQTHPHRHHHGDAGGTHTNTDAFQTPTTARTTSEPTTTPIPTTASTTLSTTLLPTTTPEAPITPVPTEPTEDPTTAEETRTTPEQAATNTVNEEEHKVRITPYSESASEASNVNFSHVLPTSPRRIAGHGPIDIIPEEPTTEAEMQTVIIQASNEIPPSSSERPTTPTPTEETVRESVVTPIVTLVSPVPNTTPEETESTTLPTTPVATVASTSPLPTTIVTTPTTVLTTAAVAETTTEEVTKQETATSTDRSSTIIGRTTETIAFAIPSNQPPILTHHIKKLAITAGKAFRYIIPSGLFTDPEEGSNLTFAMYEADNVPLSKDSWVQFIPANREVYGLPLESHVSRWNYIVEASDSEGLSAKGPLDITVQQHKGGRTINHQFIIQFKLNREYPNAIGWQIRVLEGIVNLFRDTDMDKITVLNVTQTDDMCEFVWTNDTVPKDAACPIDEINRLMKIMESDTEPGAPSAALVRAMSPELKVSGVSWRGVGRCAQSVPATKTSVAKYPPVPRNQVDHLTATVGHLLVYKVPEDTFFDPEDGGTRNLQLSLRYSDNSPIPAGHWLQFDSNNQEFYGLPAPSDVGSVNYQLIAEDSSKKTAYDSLVVEVVKSPTIRPTVEFQMTMEYPFPLLAYNAKNKRKVVEKLAALFGQAETDNIRIQSITENPTTIIWYNTSLPMDRCPKKEIEELRRMIIVDERGTMLGALKENVDHVFDKDLKVMSIRLIPLGLCAEQNTKTMNKMPPIQMAPPGGAKGAASAESGYTEYLVTFIIPAVVIVCMILVAGIIACVLYRRRRTGKMSVGDEEERQAFRSKGIPVIFQDELEERGDAEPVHKSPVIMREEKPPLLPPAPDYRYIPVIFQDKLEERGDAEPVHKSPVIMREEKPPLLPPAPDYRYIPVIFQDELEERADAEPVHKSPVIMREEKPPLLPPAPDYRSSSEDAPYRPPPPFTASRTPPRPKATPTYRKPPPYVPP